MIQGQQHLMDRRLFTTVLLLFIPTWEVEGKECEVSRARLNPTLYSTKTCPADCCSDLSYKFCCETSNDVNVTYVVVFSVSVAVVLIVIIVGFWCSYRYRKKDKKSEPEEGDNDNYRSEKHADNNGPVSRHQGHPNPSFS